MDLASAGPLEVKFIITLRRSTPVIEYRRFELGPPGESKLPLSNRKYTDFLKILNNKNFFALEWGRWISLRWLFGDSNTVVSSRWGLGGLRHFSGALRPFRHSSRGLPSGSAIWCPSSLRCAGAHYSGFVGRASSMWLLGEYGIFLFCSPRFWVVGFFLRALSSSGG